MQIPVFCNEINELVPFENQIAAENWLKENQLDTSGTSILVPFTDECQQIKFLKPNNPNNSIESKKAADDKANKAIRIMGAANINHSQGIIQWLEKELTNSYIPHLNNLEGSTIGLLKHGFIIVYKKGEQSVTQKFTKFFDEEKQTLIDTLMQHRPMKSLILTKLNS